MTITRLRGAVGPAQVVQRRAAPRLDPSARDCLPPAETSIRDTTGHRDSCHWEGLATARLSLCRALTVATRTSRSRGAARLALGSPACQSPRGWPTGR